MVRAMDMRHAAAEDNDAGEQSGQSEQSETQHVMVSSRSVERIRLWLSLPIRESSVKRHTAPLVRLTPVNLHGLAGARREGKPKARERSER